MKLIELYKNKKYGVPIVIVVFIITCSIVTIPTYFDNELINLFACFSKPHFFWHYFSGTFEHTIFNISTGELAPWFIWIHFGTNLSVMLLFGLIIERTIGSNKILIISTTAMIIGLLSFRIVCVLNSITNQATVGASGVVYAYVPIAIYIIIKVFLSNKKIIFKQVLFYVYILEIILLYIIITCLSTWKGTNMWHLISTIIGIIFLLCYKKKIDNELTKMKENNKEKPIKKSKVLWLLWILPLFMFTILILYKVGFLGSINTWWR